MNIEAKNLSKIYGDGENRVVALDRANLEIVSSDFISIMGPSGSGKSTLLHLLSGLDEGKFYIYKRMETHYDDTLLGSLQKELDSFNTSKAIEWLAYDVDYLMGEAYPGETAYVLITEDEYTFSKQGAYKLTYVDTGKTTELVDDQGFRWEASVYFVVDEDTYNENLQKMFRAEQALYDTYERILNNFGLAE